MSSPIDRDSRVESTVGRALSRAATRTVYCFRLVCGGAIAGFFLGTLICGCAAIVAASVKSQSMISLDDVLVGGFCISALGGLWGLFLGLTADPTIEAAVSRTSAETSDENR
jgi:hypothetical protein